MIPNLHQAPLNFKAHALILLTGRKPSNTSFPPPVMHTQQQCFLIIEIREFLGCCDTICRHNSNWCSDAIWSNCLPYFCSHWVEQPDWEHQLQGSELSPCDSDGTEVEISNIWPYTGRENLKVALVLSQGNCSKREDTLRNIEINRDSCIPRSYQGNLHMYNISHGGTCRYLF